MIVGLILAAEVAFWVVLAAGLGARYVLRRRRLGGALLLGVPLIDVLLLTATAIDLRGGGEMTPAHGLAVIYLGFTVGYGHYLVRWADGHAAHRFGGAPRPAKPPRYGMARARHEWRLWRLTLLAVVISLLVAQLLRWFIAEETTTDGMAEVQYLMLRVLGIHGLVALVYTVWPKKPKSPAGEAGTAGPEPAGWSGAPGAAAGSAAGGPRSGAPGAGGIPGALPGGEPGPAR
ncbi:hypothetical protein RM844_27300 [Streptomyces sp. DSM 44915]|uniref:Integral membrane protein n=1 Tax=Streptomyces chisholmiae TaxID=3075540 RepID=A0ABU2JYS0_9ACTN|nr:hypothetical protein [Streptomyces sp. DSM 44915]MDT0269992.1 hypothetical protein [Streptomyces sp. DSM 44915]